MKLQIDPKSNVPLHAQVEKLLRQYIKNQNGQNDKMFPKEVDLSKELGVARNTVRQAIAKLVQEGILVRKKGVGTIISEKKIYTRLDNWFSFTREMEEKGLHVVNHVLDFKLVKVKEDISSIFNCRPDMNLFKLTRLRGTSDKPYLLSVSWFHPRIKMNIEERFDRPLYKLLEEDYGIFVSTSKEEISAISADKKLAQQLDIKIGDPILFRDRKVYSSDGLLVEYNRVYYRGNGISYSVEIGK